MNDELQQHVQAAIDELVGAGAERGLQVAVYHHGELVVDAVAGVADPATGRPMTSDTPIFSYSIGKGVAATTLHRLAERGLIDYDTRLVEFWPEFGAHGKEATTIRHVLSQSAGVPGLPPGLTVADLCDWDKMCAIIAAEEPWWEPGTKIGYHAVTWGYLTGEIIRRISGKRISQAMLEEVAAPLGIADELFFAVTAAVQPRMAHLEDAETGEAAVFDMADDSPMLKLGPAEVTQAPFANRADVRGAEIPAGGTVTARAVAKMYAALLGEVDGVRLISPERLAEVSAVAASGTDQIFGFPTSWALGYAIEGEGTTFGVGGVGGSNAYADPAHGIAFALTKTLLAQNFETASRINGIVTSALAGASSD